VGARRVGVQFSPEGFAPLTRASRLLIYEANGADLKRAKNAIERSKRDFF
jgi:hypothetical protein